MLGLKMNQDHDAQTAVRPVSTSLPDAVGRAAHDLNNLFMLISSHAELLALYHRDDADVQQRTARILSAISAATQLTHELQLLGRGE